MLTPSDNKHNFSDLGLPVPLLHIGFPKALSSWLQKHLFRDEYGFFKILNAVELQISLIDPSPFTYTNQRALEYSATNLKKHGPLTSGTIPVATAEALIGNAYCGGFNAKQNADRLKQLFPDARILFIVREQRQLIRSLYKTLVTWGMPHSIERLLHPKDTSLAPQFNVDFLQFDLAAAYYQQLYGADNVLVLPYEAFSEDPAAFLEKIIQHAHAKPKHSLEKMPVHKRVNPNQTLLNLYLQRLHNLFFLSSPFNYAGLFSSNEKNIHRRIVRSRKNPFPAWLDLTFENHFHKTVSGMFAGKFGRSNRKLEELTGIDLARYGYDLQD
jgi:hypothetical protein